MAQYDLGTFYYNGSWVNQNREEAFQWFMKSADNGYAIAQFSVSKGILKQCSIMAVWSWRELV